MEHDFFEQKEMKALKRMAAGYVYTTIYLKLLLKSLKIMAHCILKVLRMILYQNLHLILTRQ
ncbi:phage replisome organizer N-terminal domain-containing protein [Streptococcus sp. 2022WUSS037]|uniref:phage replisome organizer N-terminal domain-containing protein n=1 Tax=Streptococcus sp. 2022WUSS037 TaxID=2983286 RepID=UPI0037D9E3E1